nr:immunoglobulin light chain junction region [Macaca mulatta]
DYYCAIWHSSGLNIF